MRSTDVSLEEYRGAPEGERAKTTKCCFCGAKSTKQEAHEGVYPRHRATMRLDRYETLDPLHTALAVYCLLGDIRKDSVKPVN